jgi:hypothetical protein
MKFERTTDLDLMKRIITTPEVWPFVSDDFSGDPESFQVPSDPRIWNMLVIDDEALLGAFVFVPRSGICWEVHTLMLPGHGAARAAQASREMAAWIWANTPCLRIITEVPDFNPLAFKFAVQAGMVQFGRNERCVMKFGELHDEILLGMNKPEDN